MGTSQDIKKRVSSHLHTGRRGQKRKRMGRRRMLSLREPAEARLLNKEEMPAGSSLQEKKFSHSQLGG